MRRRTSTTILGLAVFALACARPSPAPQAPGLPALAEDYFTAYYRYAPSAATAYGVHEYDAQLDDLSAGAIASRRDQLHAFRVRLDSVRARGIAGNDSIDALLIGNAIDAELLELERVQGWKRNPMGYISLPGGAVHGLIKRDFAPAKERLGSVIGRLRAVPAVLAAMRANVDNPPREFTDLALRVAKGSVGFYRGTVAAWAVDAAAGDSALLREFTLANEAAASAMDSAFHWLKDDLLPRSKGAYAIGPELFAAKLRAEEMVDLPLDRLLAIGEATLERDHDAAVAVAKEIDPTSTPQQVVAELSLDHPTADDLIPSVRNSIEAARRYVVEHDIATFPSEVRPTVEETPPYARVGSFASMDTPGPFEAKATEAFYYVTPPERDWDGKRVEEHLRQYSRTVVDVINVHEAYPGHFMQFLYVKQFPSRARKQLYAASNVEGWAHYAEQMMLEEGFGGGDPRMRLAQLLEALVRDCRYVVGIKLHTQGMSVADAAKCFVERGFAEPENGYEEARRGAYNPTYLYYTLGKLMTYKLRDDYQRAKGSAYTLKGFHDAFLREGGVPLPILRRLLLPGDTASVL